MDACYVGYRDHDESVGRSDLPADPEEFTRLLNTTLDNLGPPLGAAFADDPVTGWVRDVQPWAPRASPAARVLVSVCHHAF